jgi:DNA-binding beta-propeller fold protein YncE
VKGGDGWRGGGAYLVTCHRADIRRIGGQARGAVPRPERYPDGKYGYVCSSFTPETEVISVAEHLIVGKVVQASPFCPNIAATPDGAQVWLTLKDTGKTEVFDARPPFHVLATLDTGPITNHVNIVRNAHGQFAYVTIGGLNEVKVFRADTFAQIATIARGQVAQALTYVSDAVP